jgi:hypothetical protein
MIESTELRMTRLRPLLLTVFLICICAPLALAGPPFMTDDPEPVDFRQSEYYVFSTVDRTLDGYGVVGPAFEFNYGAAPNLHLHIIAPMQSSIPFSGPSASGRGDIELGAKYRFIQEKGNRPMVGTFVMVEVPTGDSKRGLGNGATIVKLPVWVQKNLGHGWQTYGGGGYLINTASDGRNTPFFGWQIQKEISKKLTLGGEWFNPGRASVDAQNCHILNFGGMYNFYKMFSLLFSGGHSVQGESHTVGYFALYWTLGKKEEEKAEGDNKPSHSMSSLLHAVGGRRGL